MQHFIRIDLYLNFTKVRVDIHTDRKEAMGLVNRDLQENKNNLHSSNRRAAHGPALVMDDVL